MLIDRGNKPLRQHAAKRGRQRLGVHAQFNQSGKRQSRIVGVQGGEHQVPRIGCAHSDFCSLRIANLAYQDDIGVLSQYRPQCIRKRHMLVDVDLADARDHIFHGIFNRHQVALAIVQCAQQAIERGGFARTCGSANQK